MSRVYLFSQRYPARLCQAGCKELYYLSREGQGRNECLLEIRVGCQVQHMGGSG